LQRVVTDKLSEATDVVTDGIVWHWQGYVRLARSNTENARMATETETHWAKDRHCCWDMADDMAIAAFGTEFVWGICLRCTRCSS
jgi:hypothetical protein